MAEKNQTKALIGKALIDLCRKESLTKISVQDIAQKASIKRQTFYYHFPDKEALIHWIYRSEALCYLIDEHISLDNWEEAALKMLKAIQQQADFYRQVIFNNREVLMTDFFQVVQPLFQQLFSEVDQTRELSTRDIEFYSRFFSYGCGGILETWIRDGFKETPLEIAMQLFRLAKDVEFFSYQLYQNEEGQGGEV